RSSCAKGRCEVGEGPQVSFGALDTVWVQVTGTLCNIACRHCFVSAGPKSTSLAVMSRGEVEAALDEAVELGARDAYYTGGEPFMHPEIRALVDLALERMPLTVLTNALLIDDDLAGWAFSGRGSSSCRFFVSGGRRGARGVTSSGSGSARSPSLQKSRNR